MGVSGGNPVADESVAAAADDRTTTVAEAPLPASGPTDSHNTAGNDGVPLAEERPKTPTNPVQIPLRSSAHETAHAHTHAHAHRTKHHRHHHNHRHQQDDSWRSFSRQQPQPKNARGGSRDGHRPDSISPSVAALLAVTSIPPPKAARRSQQHDRRLDNGGSLRGKRMTVATFIDDVQEAEQDFGLSLSRSPLDILLAAPEDFDDQKEEEEPEADEEDDDDDGGDDEASISESTTGPAFSTRTVSLESMPSLADSFATGTISSYDVPYTPNRGGGSGRKTRPTRRSLTPVSSPPGARDSDPLSSAGKDTTAFQVDVESLDFRVFQPSSPDPIAKTTEARFPLQPLKSAFKSNLTASLRALRNAARAFPTFNLTSIPPEDFLTRSLLTIDPRIPYTDERRPPPLEEEPSAALRRYLNPTSNARIDLRLTAAQTLSPALASTSLMPFSASSAFASTSTPGSPSGQTPSWRSAFTASIQMQTYKVHRAKSSSSSSLSRGAAGVPGNPPGSAQTSNAPGLLDDRPFPGPRQRELRENSDFIRIAVMEMAMRRAGKLDDRKPGRARLALPPRKATAKAYVVGTGGVPARWVAVASEDGQ
ncbi:hypothetical protein SPI_01647 [Niveomyces insectorum RCEF 264]|uniref:Uncharacterized protein n=1 Tax=Niveomyces insectorum RCEF 264 TaxID=1081102 RepID=A0A167Z4E4_9HYPO|nr:hypothetical protein SPI_01647 [Niveomyces insectorum RCEF 264]